MKNLKYFIVSLILGVSFSGCVSDVQSVFYNSQADRYYIGKQYKSAFMKYKNSADVKNPYAYYRLYVMYNYGKGVKKDIEMANIMLQRAVDLGDDTAQVIMANRLLYGKHKNVRKAIALLELAAEKENKYAYSDLAMIYKYGHGVKRDMQMSMAYERLANTNGITIAPKKKRKKVSYSQKNLIIQIQKGLVQLGFYKGKIDGIYGPMSRKSILMFQSFNGYPKNPKISQELLKQIKDKI